MLGFCWPCTTKEKLFLECLTVHYQTAKCIPHPIYMYHQIAPTPSPLWIQLVLEKIMIHGEVFKPFRYKKILINYIYEILAKLWISSSVINYFDSQKIVKSKSCVLHCYQKGYWLSKTCYSTIVSLFIIYLELLLLKQFLTQYHIYLALLPRKEYLSHFNTTFYFEQLISDKGNSLCNKHEDSVFLQKERHYSDDIPD